MTRISFLLLLLTGACLMQTLAQDGLPVASDSAVIIKGTADSTYLKKIQSRQPNNLLPKVFLESFTEKSLILDPLMEPVIIIESSTESDKNLAVSVTEEESEIAPLDKIFNPLNRYGDGRFEVSYLNINDSFQSNFIKNSTGVMGIMSRDYLLDFSYDSLMLAKIPSLKEFLNVCQTEPYSDQPAVFIGTAFLVAEDLVITAQHNLDVIGVRDMKLVSEYMVNEKGIIPNKISKLNIFTVRKVISLKEFPYADVVLLQLDRSAESGHKVLEADTVYKGQLHDKVYTIGHPVGLPMKIAANATVKEVQGQCFYTSLDTYRGNSGSPVFLQDTHRVIGVLTEGMPDFITRGDCLVSSVCYSNCKGEKVVPLSLLWPTILRLKNQNASRK